MKKKRDRYGFTVRDRRVRSVLGYINSLAREGNYEYTIVGGMAVQIYLYNKDKNSHGLRETEDIDIGLKSREDGTSLYDYMIKRHCISEESGEGYTKTLRISKIYINVDIDKGVGISEEYFNEIINDSVEVNVKNTKVKVISLEDLILTKMGGYTKGRLKDLYDVINLIDAYRKEINHEKMAEKYFRYLKEYKFYNILANLMDEKYRNMARKKVEKILKENNEIQEYLE